MKSGWVTKKLGEVCVLKNGYTPKKSDLGEDGSIPYYRISAMNLLGNEMFLRKPTAWLQGQWRTFKKGAIVFPKNGGAAYTGKLRILSRDSVVDLNTGVCLPGDEICNDYMYNWFHTLDLKSVIVEGTIPFIDFGKLSDVRLPIPPLAEQKRIVAKIDAAFEKIDKLKANAEKNLANAKELFQSALDEAMRPKKGWVEKRLGEVCSKIVDGDHNPPKGVEKSDYLMLSSKNIQNGKIIFDNPRYLTKIDFETTSKRTNVSYGDVLVTIVGTIGRSCVYEHNQPIALQRSVAVLKPNKGLVNSCFLMYYVQSMTAELETKGHGAAQKGLYLKELSSVCVCLPSIDEQNRIVAQLDALSQKTETLHQNYARQIADCAEMRQAILREAFEGKI